jgi:hypothetical protein
MRRDKPPLLPRADTGVCPYSVMFSCKGFSITSNVGVRPHNENMIQRLQGGLIPTYPHACLDRRIKQWRPYGQIPCSVWRPARSGSNKNTGQAGASGKCNGDPANKNAGQACGQITCSVRTPARSRLNRHRGQANSSPPSIPHPRKRGASSLKRGFRKAMVSTHVCKQTGRAGGTTKRRRRMRRHYDYGCFKLRRRSETAGCKYIA